MGISGLLKHIGPGERTSLATLAAKHYAKHERPLRLAIDIAIWLFQIQAGQGGSNPALRTFYYRLLRLMALNIHPVFVFDGPNKPMFKRNKKVGGPGVRVATVPEFLAKQLLKHFGYPLHVAPGEAEAECAMLQRKGVVDAVMSDDVDTIMFGSTLTLRNYTPEGSSKTPTHVDVHRADYIKSSSGLDSEGMVLVALMSGGDYIPEGIPGCGPKLAVDAAKAGFGKKLCALQKNDIPGRSHWREMLQMELKTNASKFFSRRNTTLQVPEDFPSLEVLGYYTHPCVSTTERVEELRRTLRWDQSIDLIALREFVGEAFDWRNIGGAKKFIRNLAPSILSQKLRLTGNEDPDANEPVALQREQELLLAIHGQRNHFTADKETEMRVSFIPSKMVPIDLSKEPEDDEFIPAGDAGDEAEVDMISGSQAVEDEPQTPSKRKRKVRPFDPAEPEKVWLLREWVQLGCPVMLDDYEMPATEAPSGLDLTHGSKATAKRRLIQKIAVKKTAASKKDAMPVNALMRHVQVTKLTSTSGSSVPTLAKSKTNEDVSEIVEPVYKPAKLVLPSTQISEALLNKYAAGAASRSFVNRSFSADADTSSQPSREVRTPSKQRQRNIKPLTPKSTHSSITDFFSPVANKTNPKSGEVIDLLSSPSASPTPKARLKNARQIACSSLGVKVHIEHDRHISAAIDNAEQPLHHESEYTGTEVIDFTMLVSPATVKSKPTKPAIARAVIQKSISLNAAVWPPEADARQVSSLLSSSSAIPEPKSPILDLTSVTLRRSRNNTPVKVKQTAESQSRIVAALARSAPLPRALQDISQNLQPQHAASKKSSGRITLRDSLNGAWKVQSDAILLPEDSLDASRDIRQKPTRRNAKSLRVSQVEVIDLTED